MKCKKTFKRLLCVLVVLILSVGTIWDFSIQLQRTLTKETYQTLSEVCIDYNKAFLDRISYNIKTMNVLANSLKEMQSPTKQELIRFLQNAVDDGGFLQMVVCDTNGISCSNEGISVNVSHRSYFQQAISGKATISEPLTTVLSEEESIIIAVPIQNNDTIEGVLFSIYPLSTAGTQLLDFTYYSEGYGFIVVPNGDIILSSKHTDKLCEEKNLFSFFEKTEFNDFSVAELKTAIAQDLSKSFTFTYNGERRLVSFTPSTINDWYTFSIASDSLMLHQEKITNQIVLKLIFRLVIAGILLFAWITIRNRRHNKEILTASQNYQSLLAHINGGMIVARHATTADATIATYVSSGFTDMTGYTLKDIKDLYNGRYLDVICKQDRDNVFAVYLKQLAEGNTYRMPYRIRKKDGSLIWVMDNGYLVHNADGLYNHSIITNITELKQQEEKLRQSENRFSLAINASSGALFEVDLQKQLYTHFENAERIFGTSAEKLFADTGAFSSLPFKEFADAITTYFFHPDDRAIANIEMSELLKNKSVSYEVRIRRFDDSYIWCRIDLTLNLDEFGAPSCMIGFMSDINDIKKQAELLANKVQTDPMTGLYNKIAITTLANKIMHDFPNERHALLVLDIDNFKGINDTLGHTFGDLVLLEVCTKLKAAFRSDDIVGRMGGDEFAILMKNVPDTSSVLKKATELSGSCRQTYAGEKTNYRISCSIGIIMIETNNDCFETLYRKADAALYQAKQNGKDQFVLYQEQNAKNYPIEYTRTNDEELQKMRSSHSIEIQIFELLYTSKDFNISINMALAAIGQQYHVSRVAIFENDADNLTTSNIYEWCNDGVNSAMDKLQNLKLSNEADSILNSFDHNGLLYCNDVKELPPYLRHILECKGVLSTLKITITNDAKTCGFIGFDECNEYRIWTSEEIEKLSFLAKVLSVFLFKKKAEVAVLENLHTRLKILDILPDYLCVVNPETHSLVYANNKMQELFPSAQAGAFCFTTLRGGQNGPCKTCLIEQIKLGNAANLNIISEDKKLSIKVNAISINWSNNTKMVLFYGTETSKKIL